MGDHAERLREGGVEISDHDRVGPVVAPGDLDAAIAAAERQPAERPGEAVSKQKLVESMLEARRRGWSLVSSADAVYSGPMGMWN